ncbi:uncharacterized protein FIBRA_06274 [Fibroporia radiculosa]|uniref:DUF202 domain-containing protein n=1 Tax=Fibroporia radiculosa TaxID=599839 RepID=J4H3Z7_9APHY|nr:uncharacterized protein FIBRA_06274 [Fibroporia radiculosa]CCM04114.1 predicted protein [Fibroporia radiculosa]
MSDSKFQRDEKVLIREQSSLISTDSEKPRRLYRGHRSSSFYIEDDKEILEIRARQRTFDGAFARGAMSDLGYGLMILRLFDKQFSPIGMVYTILSVLLTMVSFIRHRQSRHDFADCYQNQTWKHAMPTVGQEGTRVFGRPFTTGAWTVNAVAVIVASVEIATFVFIMQMDLADLPTEEGIVSK